MFCCPAQLVALPDGSWRVPGGSWRGAGGTVTTARPHVAPAVLAHAAVGHGRARQKSSDELFLGPREDRRESPIACLTEDRIDSRRQSSVAARREVGGRTDEQRRVRQRGRQLEHECHPSGIAAVGTWITDLVSLWRAPVLRSAGSHASRNRTIEIEHLAGCRTGVPPRTRGEKQTRPGTDHLVHEALFKRFNYD